MKPGSLRPEPLRAALMAAPLVLLVLAALAPVGALLWRGLDDASVPAALPRTLRALEGWDGTGLPGDAAFEALAADLAAPRPGDAARAGALARAADRLGTDIPALREVLPRTAAGIAGTAVPRAPALLVADPAWGETENWAALRRAGSHPSAFHPLAAAGLRRTADGGLADNARGPHARAVLARGLGVAALAVAGCLILAWPLARRIAEATPRRAALLSALTLLPFLSGEAARTLGWAHLPAGPAIGFLALVLGLLPLMALPIAIALRRAGPRLPRAAAALGARPWAVFRRIHLPLARQGIAVGCALVFVQALGNVAGPAAALAGAAGAGQWGMAGGLAFWFLLPVLPAALLLRRGMRA